MSQIRGAGLHFPSLRVHTCYCWGDWHSPPTTLLLYLKWSSFFKEKKGWCRKRKLHIGFQPLSNLKSNYYNLINDDNVWSFYCLSVWYEVLNYSILMVYAALIRGENLCIENKPLLSFTFSTHINAFHIITKWKRNFILFKKYFFSFIWGYFNWYHQLSDSQIKLDFLNLKSGEVFPLVRLLLL